MGKTWGINALGCIDKNLLPFDEFQYGSTFHRRQDSNRSHDNKAKMKLDDRETIEAIRENIYMQYFLGLREYKYEDVFDRTLFTTLRYRLGADKFDAMTRQIILRSENKEDAAEKDHDDRDNDVTVNKLCGDAEEDNVKKNRKFRGKRDKREAGKE